jgi:hypothetical protein
MWRRRFLGPILEPGPDWNEPVRRYRRDALGPTYQAKWDRERLRELGLADLVEENERLRAEQRDANHRIRKLLDQEHLDRRSGSGPIRME